MANTEEQNKLALIACLEIVLMRRGHTYYTWTLAKLGTISDCTIRDCYEHPEYLRSAMKEVYGSDYNSIVNDLKLELGDLVNVREIANFLKMLES